jgi:hypothetical protein
MNKYLAIALLLLPLICFSNTTKEIGSLANFAARGDEKALAKLLSYA